MINVLDRITHYRTQKGWTEYQLAVESGLTQSTISSWYRKQLVPSIPSLEKICVAFALAEIGEEAGFVRGFKCAFRLFSECAR